MQTRSATKVVEPRKAHSNDSNDTTLENPPGNAVSPSPKKHRRQAVTAPKRRRRGKPGDLCQLNLDVLFLISAYIHPLDLLNLARTCKSLRVLLMDKSSAFVWRSARRQVKGLPDCPDDLTEPEYANLVFYARCHGCGKQAKTILWELRRRYCSGCRVTRLWSYYSCHQIIRENNLMPIVYLTIAEEQGTWVDKEQMDSLVDEHNRSSDKRQFIIDTHEKLVAIRRHARKCEAWQQVMAADRQVDLKMRRKERVTSIFERLKQHGYDPEVVHFGHCSIQSTRRSLFRTSKPLTDKEWNRIWPEWLDTMNDLRSRRLQSVVYRPRQLLLASTYKTYVTDSSPNTPSFDLLPHVADIARFPPFQDIIRAPEGTQVDCELFKSAFAQLPALVDEWKKKLDDELAELVKIPPGLSAQYASGAVSSNITTDMESSRAPTDKLRLACALFYGGYEGIFAHPDVLSTVMYCYAYPRYDGDEEDRTGSIYDRFGIMFMEAAPYIVHACGLDPNVATVEDMDRRDARLKCLSCQSLHVGSWRDALLHARSAHKQWRGLSYDPPQWQIVTDEHMAIVHAATKKEPAPQWMRCLLCRPRVGDGAYYLATISHLECCHHIAEGDLKRGVHWAPLGMYEILRGD